MEWTADARASEDPRLSGRLKIHPSFAMVLMAVEDESVALVVKQEQRPQSRRFTRHVLLACVLAASAGLMFGYAIGISGGVSSMDDFLVEFFPGIAEKREADGRSSNYCQYSDPLLQLFTSSTYIFGLVSTFAASYTTRAWGRKPTLLIAGVWYLAGTALGAGAQNVAMLILGRVFLGCAIGFGNQAAPLYLSEIAPPHLRGALNLLFQLNITTAILIANLVNLATEKVHPWGWRLSVGLGAVPALLLTLGVLLLSETPNSLIQRGQLAEGKAVLEKIRASRDVEDEFQELVRVGQVSNTMEQSFRNLLRRQNLPPLIVAMALQFFQQAAGINAIMFYSPVLFEIIGFGSKASLMSTVLTGFTNAACTLVSMAVVDKFGRRFLLLEAGVQLFAAQAGIGLLLGIGLKDHANLLSTGQAYALVVLVVLFVSGFAWSWGPLAWLVASEIFPLEVRSAGQSVTVSTNLFFTFVVGQAFLSLLCRLKFGVFFLFAGFLVVMTLFAAFLLPETKGIPMEEMDSVWRRHWLWRRFMN